MYCKSGEEEEAIELIRESLSSPDLWFRAGGFNMSLDKSTVALFSKKRVKMKEITLLRASKATNILREKSCS